MRSRQFPASGFQVFSMLSRTARACLARLQPQIETSQTLLKATPVLATKVASITSAHGKPREGMIPPWPYRTKPYRMWHQFLTFESTMKRMDENAKIICVDGNIGVGKTEFSKKLAKELDFWYVPETTDTDVYTLGDFDLRELNKFLPPNARMYDMADFYGGYESMGGKVGGLQVRMYVQRFYKYAEALVHVLNTGQGVVLDRSVWSDLVFAEVLNKMGYISKDALKYYYMIRENSLCELWAPHLTIYLDAPVSTLRERIIKRNKPMEVNSKILNDDFLTNMEKVYKNKFIPQMRKFGEVVEYNWQDYGPEWDILVEEIEQLKLEPDLNEDANKFSDWEINREDDWSFYRRYFNNKVALDRLFSRPFWYDRCPEMFPTGDDAYAILEILDKHPCTQFRPGFRKELGEKEILWNLGIDK
ncbi:unnamed protein product [Owenia fusiformis]|uniref:NADH dehydrogenase [ubiquinone] 1 alpha subcomplex subunit 10, mitochondrial n=1 Tax=Owenia fusiformis TaxID=6347 RepID=A0A8J1UHV6_OWEFU|nr:unnamed protein product [Owenia fusiformis]